MTQSCKAERVAKGLTDGEKSRLLMGRTDWREDDWEDHCGDFECEHCSGWVDQHVAPNLLSPEDKAVRAILSKEADDGE